MIESAIIDGYGHNNDSEGMIEEMKEVDRTLQQLIAYVNQNPETLLVVTADHETGGLTLVDGDLQKGEIQCKFSTGSHSGVMVPVYAFGPGSEHFTGLYENTAIFDKIATLLKLKK